MQQILVDKYIILQSVQEGATIDSSQFPGIHTVLGGEHLRYPFHNFVSDQINTLAYPVESMGLASLRVKS